ncbi:uncharacterized protein LACBIDRAFT_291940 [Laccaria bicolor S238N-H82]|uniref:Predicted protein n=1 Tax=Laccaria bicolor (strain S238N-H82 / ATCC MYA-4686) TaxID=486041 RepID=B0CQC3_LACBS|nr:uncharacterized protein LACBIDRAFT_291940 [Laccaria bicolor S238N-H82]EDR16180.1 predicted protein [Laccaria bicolor S238N-H82]|eukprot:XP_001874388.1 predicted protein [Laccaria bicolor S238N-H82]
MGDVCRDLTSAHTKRRPSTCNPSQWNFRSAVLTSSTSYLTTKIPAMKQGYARRKNVPNSSNQNFVRRHMANCTQAVMVFQGFSVAGGDLGCLSLLFLKDHSFPSSSSNLTRIADQRLVAVEFRLKHNYRDAEKVNLTQPGSPFRLSLMFGASGCKDRELWEVSRNLDEYFRKYRNLRSGDYEVGVVRSQLDTYSESVIWKYDDGDSPPADLSFANLIITVQVYLHHPRFENIIRADLLRWRTTFAIVVGNTTKDVFECNMIEVILILASIGHPVTKRVHTNGKLKLGSEVSGSYGSAQRWTRGSTESKTSQSRGDDG